MMTDVNGYAVKSVAVTQTENGVALTLPEEAIYLVLSEQAFWLMVFFAIRGLF